MACLRVLNSIPIFSLFNPSVNSNILNFLMKIHVDYIHKWLFIPLILMRNDSLEKSLCKKQNNLHIGILPCRFKYRKHASINRGQKPKNTFWALKLKHKNDFFSDFLRGQSLSMSG